MVYFRQYFVYSLNDDMLFDYYSDRITKWETLLIRWYVCVFVS